MFLSLLQFFATKFLVLALHLESGSFPRPLSAREETEAFSALRAGDPAAREKLIRHNLRLVAHIVKKYYALPGDQADGAGPVRGERAGGVAGTVSELVDGLLTLFLIGHLDEAETARTARLPVGNNVSRRYFAELHE